MAKKSETATIKNKLKTVAKYAKKHIDDPVSYGRQELPAGTQGIAQLSACHFGVFKKGNMAGEIFFYAGGTVVEPKEFEGQATQLRTIPICDEPSRDRTLDDNIGRVMNEMKKLGLDASNYESGDLEDMAADLLDMAPCFKFSVSESEWQGKKQLWHNWHGNRGLEDFNPEEEDDVEDSTEKSEKAPSSSSKRRKPKKASDEPEEDEDALEEELEDEEIVPEKGDLFYFKPPRKRSKVEVEITAVRSGSQTVNCKDDTGKLYKSVSWDELSNDPE